MFSFLHFFPCTSKGKWVAPSARLSGGTVAINVTGLNAYGVAGVAGGAEQLGCRMVSRKVVAGLLEDVA